MYRLNTLIRLDHELLMKVDRALERMCEIPLDKIPEETRKYLGIKTSGLPSSNLFNWDLSYWSKTNIIGVNAGYTYEQIYHAWKMICMLQNKSHDKIANILRKILNERLSK